jgi:putative thioredoxin
MMASDYIIDVTEADFEYQVLNYSQKVPVVVDFWAEWCIPCRTLGPMLEKFAQEGQGQFRLAKVNVDHNPNLAMQYNVRSIPSVKAFRDGGVIYEFVGMQTEPQLREFIGNIAPSPVDLKLEKGLSMLQMEQWKSAETAFRQVIEELPRNTAAQLGLAKSILAQGRIGEAKQLLDNFPASREYSAADAMRHLTNALDKLENGQGYPEDALLAAYQRSLILFKRGNIPAAMDGLLDILREDKNYRQGEARSVLLGIFELLGSGNSLTRQYQQELASILF